MSTTVTTRNNTGILLGCGIAAGPFYTVVAVAQAVTRDGFDITKHAASLLSVGEHGWIQIANFLITGLLVLAGAIGLRRAGAFGSRWAPRLLGLYGAGLLGAGLFVPDPALGFPVGTPEGQPVSMSWHGMLHFVVGGIGFFGLIACCLVLARRFHVAGERGWSAYSVVTGVVFLAAFGGIASGSAGEGITVAFGVAVVAAWVWISLVLRKQQTQPA